MTIEKFRIKNGELKNSILEILQREGKYLSVNYLSNQLGAHWTKIYAALLSLDREGKIKSLKTPNGFFAGLKENPERPTNCGNCRYLDWYDPHFCRLTGNYDVRRDKYTRACNQALPKPVGGEVIGR